MRINISINDKLLKEFDSHCDSLHIDRSTKISELIRQELFKEQVYPGISKDQREIALPPEDKEKVEPDRSKPTLHAQEGSSKGKKVESIGKTIEKQKKAEKFCPKHGGMIVGDHYSCGCIL